MTPGFLVWTPCEDSTHRQGKGKERGKARVKAMGKGRAARKVSRAPALPPLSSWPAQGSPSRHRCVLPTHTRAG
jgi:hypothetical protein